MGQSYITEEEVWWLVRQHGRLMQFVILFFDGPSSIQWSGTLVGLSLFQGLGGLEIN